MKLKRIASLALSLALVLSLAALPAHAEGEVETGATPYFTDLVKADGSLHWSAPYVEDMRARGYANGYLQSDGTYQFLPEGTMSALQAILFCARCTNVDKTTQAQIAVDREEEVKALLPASTHSWAAAEVALALETGVISPDELEALNQTAPGSVGSSSGPQPAIMWNISRELVFRFLVRAMQLEPLAKSVKEEVCNVFLRAYYADVDDITPALRPYIYVLTYYKILEGSPSDSGKNVIKPQASIKRGEMMKIVSMAMDVVNSLGIHTELSEYTDYDWKAGTISYVSAELSGDILLSLHSEISGDATYRIPADLPIYENNMLVNDNLKFLSVGKYIRLNYSAEDQITSARLSGAGTSCEGIISAMDDGELILVSDGETQTFTISRFTEVQAGSDVGDRSVIDPLAGYTDAVCYVDSLGHLVGLKLSGGTVAVSGLFQGMTTAADGTVSLTLNSFEGIPTVYTVPPAAVILVNGAQGTLAASHVGRYTTLRLPENGSQAVAVSVDTLTSYLQGRIIRQGTGNGEKTLVITNVLDFNREDSYPISSTAAITYAGEERNTSQIENGWFITARLVGGAIVEMTAFPSTTTAEGTLAAIQYGTITVLEVTPAAGGTITYELDITKLPTITRSGKKATVDQLRVGDSLVLTLRYNEVQEIAATPQEANLSGVISGISMTTSGNSIEVTLTDGTTATYTIGEGVAVTKNGSAATLRDLNAGDAVAMVTSGDTVVSVAVTAAVVSNNQITGTVYTVTNVGNTRAMTVLVEGRADPVTVDLRAGSATIMSNTGSSLSLSSLQTGDKVDIYGSYSGNTFVATLVIKK